MAATLVATVGASTANAYDTWAASGTYFDDREGEAVWDAMTEDVASRWLIMATADIDLEVIDGPKLSTGTTSGVPDQALRFPRAIDSDTAAFIPVAVKHAMFEQALHRSQTTSSNTRADLQSQGVVEVKHADIREKYGSGGSKSLLCIRARQLLSGAALIKVGSAWA